MTKASKQRYKCQNVDCSQYSFQLDLIYKGHLPEIKEQVIEMALNGSGIRDTPRVLKISPTTVISELKKRVDAQLCEPASPHPVEPGWSRDCHSAR
jgi:transposase-like protein